MPRALRGRRRRPYDARVITDVEVRGLTRREYDLLVDAGAFADEKVELLHGRLYRGSPSGPRHAWVIELLNELLSIAYRGVARVRVQLPLAAGDDAEPEPDLAVVERRPRGGHPASAWLVVEVADSSRTRDLSLKAPVYAAAGVDPYWVVDLTQEQVVVHRDPHGDAYGTVERVGPGERLALPRIDGAIAVDDLLGW